MWHDLSGDAGVHAGQTEVSANVGVVQIDDRSAAEVSDVLIIYFGVRRGGDDGGGADGGDGAEEGAAIGTLGFEGSLAPGLLRIWYKRDGRTI